MPLHSSDHTHWTALAEPHSPATHWTLARPRRLATSLGPGRDVTHSSVAETHALGGAAEEGGGAALRRVALCALPTQCSRHNSPAHPYAPSAPLTQARSFKHQPSRSDDPDSTLHEKATRGLRFLVAREPHMC